MAIYLSNEFDHTPGCYITDYILCFVIVVSFVFCLLTKQKIETKKGTLIRRMIFASQIKMAIFALLGGMVHQLFTNDDNKVFYSMVWNLSCLLSIFGYTCLFLSSYFLMFHINMIVIITLICILIALSIANFTMRDNFLLQAPTGVITLIANIVLSILYYKKNNTDENKKYCIIRVSGCGILIVGAVLQALKIQISEALNYNFVYHILNMIGIVLLIIPYALTEYSDDKSSSFEIEMNKTNIQSDNSEILV